MSVNTPGTSAAVDVGLLKQHNYFLDTQTAAAACVAITTL